METKNAEAFIPPSSKESEMMVLGCMLSSVNALNIAADSLQTEDFYFLEHKLTFDALRYAYANEKPADILLISEELKRRGKLDEAGGIAYLTSLAQFAGSSTYIEEYVDLVRSKAILRRMIDVSQRMQHTAYQQPDDVLALLDETQQLFFQIGQAANPHMGVTLRDLLTGSKATSKMSYLKELQTRQEEYQIKGPGQGVVTGIPTHFVDLDKIVNGFGPSNLIILAARPAMGKTALALNIAENVCFRNQLPVGIFSLEMTSDQLLHRLICSQAQIESEKIKTGALNGYEFQRIVECVNEMQKHTFIIDDQPGLKITELRSRARRMRDNFGVELIVIDYLQLLSGSGYLRNQDNRQNEISEISRMLKNLARELGIPVLCLSQLSRKVEERTGHRPMMSDLRESGCLAGDTLIEDADTGKQIKIKDLATKQSYPLMIWAKTDSLTLEKHKMTKVFSSGIKDVYLLTTIQGRRIRASANHPFWTQQGWRRLDHLQEGDLVAVRNQNSPLIWDAIRSVDLQGPEEVFDATVFGVHNFLANDFLVHNSIEQDADVVMFLLRREYYDPFDKPGQAELIVAKNRHGAVGNVNLSYRKEISQFANFSMIDAPPSAPDPAFASFSPK